MRQHAGGGKPKLEDIRKRGYSDLRGLLVHGGAQRLAHSHERDDRSRWQMNVATRRHRNIAGGTSQLDHTHRLAALARDESYRP